MKNWMNQTLKNNMRIILNHFTHHPQALHHPVHLSHPHPHHHPHPQVHQYNTEKFLKDWIKQSTRNCPRRRCVPKL